MSAEYILNEGNPNVILCERGIRTFETAARYTLDLSAVPILKSKTHLPVIVDPAHALGLREFVPQMCLAAVAAGADALMIEVHDSPEMAKSDGNQALTPEIFAELVPRLRARCRSHRSRVVNSARTIRAIVCQRVEESPRRPFPRRIGFS